jgi:outer membrane protein assembly factor BamB
MISDFNDLGSCAIHRDLLFAPTGNSAKWKDKGVYPATNPTAPTLVCLNKRTGEVVWQDHSDSLGLCRGAHSSPLVIDTGAGIQVVHAQGDGWVRGFDAATGKLIWKFDTNPKGAEWMLGRSDQGKRVVTATPVYAEGLIYFAHGYPTEISRGPGRLFCIEPAKKTGDISKELEDDQGTARPNPNSGLIWDFARAGHAKSDQMHLCGSSVAVESGLVIATDTDGYTHCFGARTGERHWVYDCDSDPGGNTLIIDDKVYIPTGSGDVPILRLSKTLSVLARPSLNQAIESPLVFANRNLYILTIQGLFAIEAKP